MFLIDDIISGIQAASAAKKAAKAQQEATQRGMTRVTEGGDLGLGYLTTAESRQAPWLAQGEAGLMKLSDLAQTGFNAPTEFNRPSDFKFGAEEFVADPGYQFRLKEGLKGTLNSAAASSMGLSGAQLKALAQYNQGFASNEFNTAYNRAENTFAGNYGRAENTFGENYERALQQYGTNLGAADLLAGYGERSRGEATGINKAEADLAYNRGLTLADLETQGGNARASGYIGAGNAYSDMIGNIAGSAAQFLPGGQLADILKKRQPASTTRGYSV